MKYSIYSKLSVGICSAFLITVASSCMEDAYNPNANKNELPPIDQVFGFETRGDVKLTIDYNAPGYNQVFFMIFSENPVVMPGTLKLKEGIKPIYSAFTGKDGKLEGAMSIPTSVKEAWIYTDRLGVSGCVKMNFVNGIATYDAAANSTVVTRSATDDTQLSNWFNTGMPYGLMFGRKSYQAGSIEEFNYFSVVKWGIKGAILDKNGTDVYMAEKTDNGSLISDISKRTTAYLGTIPNVADRKKLLRDASTLNVTTPEDGTKLQVVFLDEAAAYNNVFGYYYYKKGSELDNTKPYMVYDNLKPVKKYILFPNLSKYNDEDENGTLKSGTAVKLKFFGESGTETATEDFPKDYVIGWFLMSNGFVASASDNHPQYSIGDAGRINDPDRYNNSLGWGSTISSNDVDYKGVDYRRFISLYDETSKSLVIGVEDKVGAEDKPDDYCDLTFIVTSNKDLKDEDKPIIPPVDPIFKNETISGTLVFEDTWPRGGDYDLNDVAVEYERTFTFGEDNKVTKLVEKFKFIQEDNAANNTNYFAYQVENGGNLEGGQNGTAYEIGSKSFMITENSAIGKGKTYTFIRNFSKGSEILRNVLQNDFNPYIIVTKNGTSFGDGQKEGRIEVHLPKYKPTKLANIDLTSAGEDVYYTDAKTHFPFAIDITTVADKKFTLCPEKKNISTIYSRFASWAGSIGKDDTDWYTDAPKSGN